MPTTSFHQNLTAYDEEKEGSFQQSEVDPLQSALGDEPLEEAHCHQSSVSEKWKKLPKMEGAPKVRVDL